MMEGNSDAPALSVILPTDSYEAIQPVLERLRQQTVARRLEIILIATASADLTQAMEGAADFLAVRVFEIESLFPLGAAREAGVRAARAPLVFVGETHSFLFPDAAEKLIATAASGPWAVVAPGFENGNPTNLLSWSSFLADYGHWSACLPAGEISAPPIYNALYRREVLLEMAERLAPMLSYGDELRLALRARGHRAYFEPAARIDHWNINEPLTVLHERFLAGALIGGERAQRWPWWRRLGYALGSPLISLVLFWRVFPGAWRTSRESGLSLATLPPILLLLIAKGVGEFVGYSSGRPNDDYEAAMSHYEIRKRDYLV